MNVVEVSGAKFTERSLVKSNPSAGRDWNANPGELRDALVVGGGLAGPALAILLARAGRDVLLIEKSAGPHPKVCGEFLSYEALHYLQAIGVDPEALGAVPIETVRLARHEVLATTRLPFRSLSLSRARLDEALLQLAASDGVAVLRSRRVQSLKKEETKWAAQTDQGEIFCGRSAFLATGKHDLFGWNRPRGKQNDLLAFKMYWRLAQKQHAELAAHVELILFPGGYIGLQPVEEGIANLCLLVRRKVFKRIGATWPALLTYIQRHATHLATRLRGASACWECPLSLSSIPYGYVRAQALDGLWRLGDQSAVIPSFAGDGMSMALHSANLAAATYVEGGSAEVYQQRLAHALTQQVGLATLLSRSLVTPYVGSLLSTAARWWPGVLAHVAQNTRIHAKDLLT